MLCMLVRAFPVMDVMGTANSYPRLKSSPKAFGDNGLALVNLAVYEGMCDAN